RPAASASTLEMSIGSVRVCTTTTTVSYAWRRRSSGSRVHDNPLLRLMRGIGLMRGWLAVSSNSTAVRREVAMTAHIYVVDDTPHTLQLMTYLLQAHAHRVTGFSNAEAALAALEAGERP